MTKLTKSHEPPAKTLIRLGGEDSAQPGHPPSLIRVFAVCKDSDQNAQSDLSLYWAHSHFVGFVMRQLKSVIVKHYHDFRNLLSETQKKPCFCQKHRRNPASVSVQMLYFINTASFNSTKAFFSQTHLELLPVTAAWCLMKAMADSSLQNSSRIIIASS